MRRKLALHESKIFAYIYPLYAREFMFYSNYESFVKLVAKDFDLTPEQWNKLQGEWEFKEMILKP